MISVGIAGVVAFIVTWWLARPGSHFRILDHPNERSLHTSPTPRTGGIAIWAGGIGGASLVIAKYGVSPAGLWIAMASVAAGSVSLIDDWRGIPVGMRFAVHVIAAVVLIFGADVMLTHIVLPGVECNLSPFVGMLLSLLFVVWMTNLYNFMDGMDGFAGGMAVCGFGVFGLLGYMAGDTVLPILCWVIAAAAGGFLVVNFPPARIFMGDTGSSVLGLLVAAISLWAESRRLFPLWVAVLVFSPFIVDATVTLLRRLFRGERIWQAHRTHYYQRLVQLGWGHRKTVLIEYFLMGSCAISAIVAVNVSAVAQWVIIVFWVAVYLCLISAVERADPTDATKKGAT